MRKRKIFWSLVMSLGMVMSCKKDTRTHWDTEMLVPIATTNLSLQNLVSDSSSLQTNPDNSLTLAYKTSLYRFNLADNLITIPDTGTGKTFTLDGLSLAEQKFRYRNTLGDMANRLLTDPDPGNRLIGQIIISQNGSSIPVPPISGLITDKFHFDAVNLFDSANLLSGNFTSIIINHLPFPLGSTDLVIKNSSDNSIVATKTIPIIPAYDSFYFVIPLSGKHVTSQLDLYLTDLNTPGTGSTPVRIDTTDHIEVRIVIGNMKASEAWAKFPSQNVLDQTDEITQIIQDRKLTYVNVRRGKLRVFLTSTVQEALNLEYTLVGAYDKAGKPLVHRTRLPAAPTTPPYSVTVDSLIDIQGYSINLTGADGTKFNTYTQRITAGIDSSGITRHITIADGLTVRYEMTEVAPSYVKGYLGRDTIVTTDTSAFSFLDMFKSGTLDLESVNMSFEVENGLGVDGEVKINSLTATSPVNGSRNLTGSILGKPLVVDRASDFPLRPAVNKYSFNNSNSNIKDLLGILPSQLRYDVEVKTNVGGNNQQYRDFAYLESSLNINLNAEIPLAFIASHLILQDTIGFDISQTNTNVEGISDGVINLIAQNKYPLEPILTMVVYDSAWAPVDTLLLNTKVDAGELDNNCRVQMPKRTKVPLYVNQDRMTNLKRGRNAVITADFSSSSNNAQCNGQHLKIYSDYDLDITFTARFNYQVNAKF